MKVLDAEFVQGFIRMANDGWEQGWHERNGGNLSYRIRPEEVVHFQNLLYPFSNLKVLTISLNCVIILI